MRFKALLAPVLAVLLVAPAHGQDPERPLPKTGRKAGVQRRDDKTEAKPRAEDWPASISSA